VVGILVSSRTTGEMPTPLEAVVGAGCEPPTDGIPRPQAKDRKMPNPCQMQLSWLSPYGSKLAATLHHRGYIWRCTLDWVGPAGLSTGVTELRGQVIGFKALFRTISREGHEPHRERTPRCDSAIRPLFHE
jgi:hypothetical protein